MGVTIKDIAKKLGVSATAVSKALNNREDVSEELKRKVRKMANEMDYSPNSIAKRLVTNKSNTLGVFMLSRREESTHDNIGFQFISGILEEANKSGYDIVMFSTNSDLLSEKSYIRLCKERRVEGAVFTGLRLDDPHIEEIQKSPFPISIIDTKINGDNLGYVGTDNYSGVKKALSHLWQLGHRRIGLINGHKNAQVSQVRFEAYRDFLYKRNSFDQELIYNGDFTMESGYNIGIEILHCNKKLPTAFFTASDLMALGLMKSLKDNNLKIPDDISIVGFDNIFTGMYIEPALTTVGQEAVKMGQKAANWVIKRLNGEKIKRDILLEPELIVRNSTTRVIK